MSKQKSADIMFLKLDIRYHVKSISSKGTSEELIHTKYFWDKFKNKMENNIYVYPRKVAIIRKQQNFKLEFPE